MAKRLEGLIRIEAVQKQVVRLAEMRLAASERACHELKADRTRLETYVTDQGALGAPLARAALKSLHTLDRRHDAAVRDREGHRAALQAAKRREHGAGHLRAQVAREVRRVEDDRALADIVDVRLSCPRTSLP